jgi:serine/threonine-protein kinase
VPLDQCPGCEGLPESLVRGVQRALDKDPERRPPNAGALANVLGLVLHRDMDIPVAAKLRVLNPDDTVVERLFLPGSYLIGSGRRCEIKLRDDTVPRVHAVLEWSGVPGRPHLRPLTDDGSVKVNDHVVHGAVELGAEDEFSVGSTRMAVVI